MSTKATPDAINALIDASSSDLKIKIAALDWSIPPPVVTPPIIDPPTTGTNPGGKASQPTTYNNISNQTITGLSFDGSGKAIDLLTLNNCTNVHITLCRFSNNTGIAIKMSNCTGCTVDFNFFTSVGFGIYVANSKSCKVNNNQGLNRNAPVKYNNNFSHWAQFNNCSGDGQQINNNIFEDIAGVAVNPHDHISIYATNGSQASPLQCNGNKLRGGQLTTMIAGSGDTGGGIMPGDGSGSWQICQGNIMVNPGCAGIQTVGNATNIVIDGNKIFSVSSKVAAQGITILDSQPIKVTNNSVFWTNKNGLNTLNKDGEPSYFLGNSVGSATNVSMSGNTWQDKTITAAILPPVIITYK